MWGWKVLIEQKLLTKDASKGRKINRIITLDSGNDKKLKISDFASSKQGW